MVAAVQCDGNGSICFSCAAKVDPACQVPIITNHATIFGSICCLKQQKHVTQLQFVVTGLSQVCKLTYNSCVQTCAHAAWQTF